VKKEEGKGKKNKRERKRKDEEREDGSLYAGPVLSIYGPGAWPERWALHLR
jgi:hypothetical protein